MSGRTVIGLPVVETERYLSRTELAASLNLHVNTLDRLRKEPGFPEERWGLSTPRFLRSRVLAWLREREARSRGKVAA